jgi:hypothetical protein
VVGDTQFLAKSTQSRKKLETVKLKIDGQAVERDRPEEICAFDSRSRRKQVGN